MKYKIGQELHIGRFHGKILKYKKGKNYKTICEYECLNCGYKGEKDEYSISHGSGCPVCANKLVMKGLNDIATTDPWMIPYFQGGVEEASLYTNNSEKRIIPKCPFCGRVKDKSITINNIYWHHGFGCACKDGVSIPNKFIYNVLEQCYNQSQISNYIREFKLKEDMTRSYDVYFEKDYKKYIVEMDGGLGHGRSPTRFKKLKLDNKETLAIDEYKDDIAQRNGIDIIRIDVLESNLEYIQQQVINSRLSQILDLSRIDWLETYKFCCSNLVKTVCDYKKAHPNSLTTDAAKIFHIDRSTIGRYWKQGIKLGWCDYDPKADNRRSVSEYSEQAKKSIHVTVVTLDNTIMHFKSLYELDKVSSDLFGVHLSTNTIRYKCKNTNQCIYKGYIITLQRQEENNSGISS